MSFYCYMEYNFQPIHRCLTVILFIVRVPVLSEHMHDVEPSVQTDYKFLTKTFFAASFLAVIANDIVTHARIPSGTLATIIPIPNTMHSKIEYPTTNLPSKIKITPKLQAIIVIINTKLSSSCCKGDFYFFYQNVKLAIVERYVFLPVAITIPRPFPCRQQVPKNATLLDYNILVDDSSTFLSNNAVQPVIDELSTFIFCDAMTLISAGILYPILITTKSPITNYDAGIDIYQPDRIVLQLGGNISLNFYMIYYDLAAWRYVIVPVIKIIAMIVAAKYNYAQFPYGQSKYIIMAKNDPIHNRIENQFVTSLKNLNIGCGFYLRGIIFWPYFAIFQAAFQVVSPSFRFVFNR